MVIQSVEKDICKCENCYVPQKSESNFDYICLFGMNYYYISFYGILEKPNMEYDMKAFCHIRKSFTYY